MSTPQAATRREWLGLTVLMLPTVLLALDKPGMAKKLNPKNTKELYVTVF